MSVPRLGKLQGCLDIREESMKRLELDLASSLQAAASALANEKFETTEKLDAIRERIATEHRLQDMDQQLKETQVQAEAYRKRY